MANIQFVGSRYVPKLEGQWNNEQAYEVLSIVQYQGNSYTSRQPVPVGIDISNQEYWVNTGNYSFQMQEIQKLLEIDLTNINNAISNLQNVTSEHTGQITGLSSAVQTLQGNVSTLQGDVKQISTLLESVQSTTNQNATDITLIKGDFLKVTNGAMVFNFDSNTMQTIRRPVVIPVKSDLGRPISWFVRDITASENYSYVVASFTTPQYDDNGILLPTHLLCTSNRIQTVTVNYSIIYIGGQIDG